LDKIGIVIPIIEIGMNSTAHKPVLSVRMTYSIWYKRITHSSLLLLLLLYNKEEEEEWKEKVYYTVAVAGNGLGVHVVGLGL